jgi:CheY-like chemotaxis protein
MLMAGDENLLVTMESALESLDVRIVRAASITDGITKFHYYSPNLVISAFKLSGGGGMKALREFRDRFAEKNTPFFIAVNSAQKLLMKVQIDKRYRADGLISLPLKPEKLLQTVTDCRSKEKNSVSLLFSDLATPITSDLASDIFESSAEAASIGNLPKSGTFGQHSFPGLLHKIRTGGYSCVMEVNAVQNGMKVYFGQGMPIAVESGYIANMTLGSVLVENGKITDAQHRKSLSATSVSGKRQGEILVEEGLLSASDLRSYLALHSFNKICFACTFSPRETRFKLSAGMAPPEGWFTTRHDPGRIIVRGVRSYYSYDRLRVIFGKKGRSQRPISLSKRPNYNYHRLGFSSDEERIVSMINGTLTAQQLAQLAGVPVPLVYKVVYPLLIMKVVRLEELPD